MATIINMTTNTTIRKRSLSDSSRRRPASSIMRVVFDNLPAGSMKHSTHMLNCFEYIDPAGNSSMNSRAVTNDRIMDAKKAIIAGGRAIP